MAQGGGQGGAGSSGGGLGAWRGLFDWSMSYQDGTKPTDWSSVETSPEKIKWCGVEGARAVEAHTHAATNTAHSRLEGVMKEYMVNFTDRMAEIKGRLDSGAGRGDADAQLGESERLLEELRDIVDSIDHARDLHTIGGLPTLLGLMQVGLRGMRRLEGTDEKSVRVLCGRFAWPDSGVRACAEPARQPAVARG